MAWLIALALLLWIGSAIFSAADKAQHRAQEQKQIRDDELKAKIDELKSKYGCNIIVVHNTQIDVSSTELREKLKNGESVKDYINPKVERYIQENGLYK